MSLSLRTFKFTNTKALFLLCGWLQFSYLLPFLFSFFLGGGGGGGGCWGRWGLDEKGSPSRQTLHVFLSANILWLSVINVLIFLKAFLKKSLLKYTKAYWLTNLCFITIFNREFRMLYWSNPRRSVAVNMLLSKREGFVQIGADLFTTQHFNPGWMLMVRSENIMALITSKLIFWCVGLSRPSF